MGLTTPLGHEELLTLARKAEAAARDGDRERLEVCALRLSQALADHVDAERPALRNLPPEETRPLLLGQEYITRLIADLAVAARTGGLCRRDDIAQRLLAQLTVQAEDERHRLASAHQPA
jgi:hypothetical protein